MQEIYPFQIAGPTSLQVLERATDESLRDIGFLKFRDTQVEGLTSEVCRIGMSGTLAYELRGPLAEGPEVYDAVVRAGADLGIERLGWRTYTVNHVEGGFPQSIWTFMAAAENDAGYMAFLGNYPALQSHPYGERRPGGHAERVSARRSSWTGTARRASITTSRAGAALEQEVRGPEAHDRHAALERGGRTSTSTARCCAKGEPYNPDRAPDPPASARIPRARGPRAARRQAGRRLVRDRSTACTTARSSRTGCIDLASAEIGMEVVVQHGNHGGPIKDVRATVARYPYLDLERNQTYDIGAVPSGVPNT